MPQLPAIRLLAPSKNVGDLFTWLVQDLFEGLGYEVHALNVGTAGREIDIKGRHRGERSRLLCAECKATSDPIGGGAVNKFLGVLVRERNKAAKSGQHVDGYFVSLTGYTSTAVDQERELSGHFNLYTGADVVSALERGNRIVSRDRVLERAGRCAARLGSDRKADPPQLLGHEERWIWAVIYRKGGVATHVALLLGTDGEPLHKRLAQQILTEDEKGPLGGLSYLAAPHDEDLARSAEPTKVPPNVVATGYLAAPSHEAPTEPGPREVFASGVVSEGAIFVSYAREDFSVTRRLVEGLRSAGLEVWLDQDVLQIGDTWERSIRRGIERCALFLPVLSHQSLNEENWRRGYWQEWREADRLARGMGLGEIFIIPVVIDDTPIDPDVLLLPDSFLDAHVERLVEGKITPEVTSRLMALVLDFHRRRRRVT